MQVVLVLQFVLEYISYIGSHNALANLQYLG